MMMHTTLTANEPANNTVAVRGPASATTTVKKLNIILRSVSQTADRQPHSIENRIDH
jgi:hypothetical protein